MTDVIFAVIGFVEVGKVSIKLRRALDYGIAGGAQPFLVGPIGVMEPIEVGNLGGVDKT